MLPACHHVAGSGDAVGGSESSDGVGPTVATEDTTWVIHPTDTAENWTTTVMLFLTYWKLNEGISVRDTNDIATSLTGDGLFPPEGVEVLRWDTTPDGWGIVLWDADGYAAIHRGLNVWRAAADDTAFFEETRTAPAAPVEEVVAETTALLERIE